MIHFPDHHIFSIDDWKEIKNRFEKIENKQKIILTTEKDAVRLVKFGEELENVPLYVIPIEHFFLFNEREIFLKLVTGFIETPLNLTA
jgi:tetraacyldisaccharide 4'-kinase